MDNMWITQKPMWITFYPPKSYPHSYPHKNVSYPHKNASYPHSKKLLFMKVKLIFFLLLTLKLSRFFNENEINDFNVDKLETKKISNVDMWISELAYVDNSIENRYK